MKKRHVTQVVKGQRVSDGDGVRLTRIIGLTELPDLDPFLLLDAFQSDNPNDYIGGFPPHPHRGFETVTYLLAGRMRHKDSAGNEGVIEPGGIQWMTAGKGIIHSEMPEQKNGLLHGFQLWVNLPAKDKMTAPAYQEYDSNDIPVEKRSDDISVHVLSGTTTQGTSGPVQNNFVEPLYFDIELKDHSEYIENIPAGHNAFIYTIEGDISIVSDNKEQTIAPNNVVVLSDGETVHIKNRTSYGRILLIAGKPIKEKIARGGPFVMNTEEEIHQAFSDYQRGNFA